MNSVGVSAAPRRNPASSADSCRPSHAAVTASDGSRGADSTSSARPIPRRTDLGGRFGRHRDREAGDPDLLRTSTTTTLPQQVHDHEHQQRDHDDREDDEDPGRVDVLGRAGAGGCGSFVAGGGDAVDTTAGGRAGATVGDQRAPVRTGRAPSPAATTTSAPRANAATGTNGEPLRCGPSSFPMTSRYPARPRERRPSGGSRREQPTGPTAVRRRPGGATGVRQAGRASRLVTAARRSRRRWRATTALVAAAVAAATSASHPHPDTGRAADTPENSARHRTSPRRPPSG